MEHYQPSTKARQRNHARWYDRTPELGQAIVLLEALPSELQIVLAREISQSIRREGRKKMLPGQLRQIGPEKIMGLMKSKAKKRWHDQNADLHKAFNDIFLTEAAECRETSLRIMVAISVFEQAKASGRTMEECERLIQAVFLSNRKTLVENARKLIIPGMPPSSVGDIRAMPSARRLSANESRPASQAGKKQKIAISAAADKLLPQHIKAGQ